jgi:hypothetical protein
MAVTVPAEMTADSGNYGAMFTPKVYSSTNVKILTGQFSFSDEYPVAGESMNLSDYFTKVLGVMFANKAGYVFEYDYENSKVKAMYADYDAAADGALIPVPNATDLSEVTGVRFIAWGL